MRSPRVWTSRAVRLDAPQATVELGGASGIAVVGTIFFAYVRRGAFAAGLERALTAELGLLLACCALVTLLPLKAREQSPDSHA